jgi:FtsP/CotA-like multicopper oxidase with cupredoxin domain
MPDPGPGSMTFFYTNQQSARLMFYHDHSYGITRLNVYAGEAAGYIVQDTTESQLVANGQIPSDQIPLIIQDKTFVPGSAQLTQEDPTWNTAEVWRRRQSLVPARLHAQPEPGRRDGRQCHGPLGLRAMVLAAVSRA